MGPLIYYLGGESIAGGMLKETGTINWTTPMEGATNETGYSALPGEVRTNDNIQSGIYNLNGDNGYWWSSTESDRSNGWFRSMYYFNIKVLRYNTLKSVGLSVGCIED